MDGAGSAGGNATSKLGTSQIEFVTNNPEERRVRLDIYIVRDAVHVQTNCHESPHASDGPIPLLRIFNSICDIDRRDSFDMIRAVELVGGPTISTRSAGTSKRKPAPHYREKDFGWLKK
jgi:hypothetical protein